MNVRVPGRMDIAERSVDDFRDLELDHVLRCLEKAGRARLDAVVARLREEQRQPADFELRAGAHHQIRVANARDQAWAPLDAMRILQSRVRRKNGELDAARLLRERAPLRLAA